MEKIKKNAIVGQSGGPTAAINATLSGVIRGVLSCREIDTLYGMQNGLEGFLQGRTVSLTAWFEQKEEDLRRLTHTPAAMLGSCRFQLPDPTSSVKEDQELYQSIFDRLRAMEIGYFFYIGGNDSMDTVAKLARYVDLVGEQGIRVIGIPKTIDNDLCETDHTPGFGSAAKYVATSVQEILYDCAVYTQPAVTVVEIMGRDAGWLTAASSLGRLYGAPEPDYVFLPERAFDTESFLSRIRQALKRHPNVVIAVSEGLRFANGSYVGIETPKGGADGFSHVCLGGAGRALARVLRSELGCKTRAVELNVTQRCAGHLLSRTDIEESVELGARAVEAALSGASGDMMCLRRMSNTPYACAVERCPAKQVANRVRSVPDAYINDEGDGVTDACLSYLAPLVEGEAYPSFQGGIPQYYRKP